MKINPRSSAVFTLAVFILFVSATGTNENADAILQAEREKKPIPVLTLEYPALTLEQSYEIQAEYVRKRLAADKIAGFKAGLTSRAVREKFGVDAPVSGVLLSSGMYEGSPVIDGSKFRSLMIEAEIGFIVGKPITERSAGVSQLKEHVSAIVPVIELPEFGFSDMKKLKVEDIVAANVGSAAFINGVQIKRVDADLNGLTVKLSSGGELLSEGRGSDAMGGQWEALLWLMNSVIEHGWNIERGTVLITGSLGKVIPGKPGSYQADYGEMGKISFEIR